MPRVSLQELSQNRPTAIALGNFDGVHVGHRHILQELQREAKVRGLEPVALTFDPHPRHFLSPEQKAPLLTPCLEKEAWLRDCGVAPVTLEFNSEMANLPAEDFVSQVLIGKLRGGFFLLGPGHRFGKGAKGDFTLLAAMLGRDCVREIPPIVDESGEVVSSSGIRRHLEAGQVGFANRMLGRPYCLSGKVVRGKELGRTLGFPTANLQIEEALKALPAFGVYGGTAVFKGRLVPAVGNIGLRPTIAGDKTPAIEVHVLDVSEDLYGVNLAFELQDYLRPEKTFDSLEALRLQITADVNLWRARQGSFRNTYHVSR